MALDYASPAEIAMADKIRQSSIGAFNAKYGTAPSLAPGVAPNFGAVRELPGSRLATATNTPTFTNADLGTAPPTSAPVGAASPQTTMMLQPSQVARTNMELNQPGMIMTPPTPSVSAVGSPSNFSRKEVLASMRNVMPGAASRLSPTDPFRSAPSPVAIPAPPSPFSVVSSREAGFEPALTPYQSINGVTSTWKALMEGLMPKNRYFGTGG